MKEDRKGSFRIRIRFDKYKRLEVEDRAIKRSRRGNACMGGQGTRGRGRKENNATQGLIHARAETSVAIKR